MQAKNGKIVAEVYKVADDTPTELLNIPTLFVTMYTLRLEGEHDALHLWLRNGN